MKKVYIILSYTGTWLAKVVRYYTKKEYSHVSISLDENLQRMYSFGRKNPYISFWGGFVHESTRYGTFKRFQQTKAVIYQIEITDEQYQKLSKNMSSLDRTRVGKMVLQGQKKRRFSVFEVSFKS